MRKLALVHKAWFAATAVTDRWRCLFEALRDECGFELMFIEDAKRIPADVDVVLFACAAGHFDDKRVRALYHHGYKGKRILYLADYIPRIQPHAASAIVKADLVLAPEAATYRKRFPDKRIEFFPYFFAPHDRYASLPWNATPKMRCLVSGPANRNYPIRSAAIWTTLTDVLPHTGSHGAGNPLAVVRDDYAKRLNEYFCAVAGSLRGGITTKTFEIMAAGALLITDPVADMDELGMHDGEHYVAANHKNVREAIGRVIGAPTQHDAIRRAGMEYARARHGIRNRVGQFRAITETL